MLKEIRESRGFTLRELAAKSGVDNADISAMENNRLTMGSAAAAKLAQALEVDKEELQAAQAEARLQDLGEQLTALDPAHLADVTGANPDKAKAAIVALLDLGEEDLHPEIKKVVEQTLLKLLKSTKQAAAAKSRQPDRDLHGRKRPAAQESKRDPAGRSREPEPVKRDPQGRRQK